jgi:hypothetical protein
VTQYEAPLLHLDDEAPRYNRYYQDDVTQAGNLWRLCNGSEADKNR